MGSIPDEDDDAEAFEAEVVDGDPTTDADENSAREAELVDEGDEAFDAEVIDVDAEPAPSRSKMTARAATQVRGKEPSGALTRYDPLQAYMRDVNRYEVLDAETQKKLAIEYQESGDVDAAARLVTSNLRLVVKIAYDYRRAYRNLMDLVQEGNIGLMQAVKKYDPYKGVKLSSYAAWWIRAYILRFILNNWRLVKLGTTQAQRKLFFNLNKEKAKLSAMGIEPTAEAIAKRLDVSEKDVTSMDRRLSGADVSLDAPVSNADGSSTSRIDMLPSGGGGIDELLADEELGKLLHDELHSFGKTLEGKEHRIYHERLLSDDPRTLQELGDAFGVSRERVRQLEKRLQGKLRTYLEQKLGTEVLEQQ